METETCDICKSEDNVQSIVIGVDGYGRYLDKDSKYWWLCKFCRDHIILTLEHMKENNYHGE